MNPTSKAILELVDEGLKFHHVVVKGNADSNVEAMVRLKFIGLAPPLAPAPAPAHIPAAAAPAPVVPAPAPVPAPASAPAPVAVEAAPAEETAVPPTTTTTIPDAAPAGETTVLPTTTTTTTVPEVAPAAVEGAAPAPAEVEETTMAEGSCEEMEAAVVMASVSNGTAAAAPAAPTASITIPGPVGPDGQPQEQQQDAAAAAGFKVENFKVSVTRIDGAPVSKDNKVAKNFIRVIGFDQLSNDFYKIKMKMCDSTNKNFAVYRITAVITDDVNK